MILHKICELNSWLKISFLNESELIYFSTGGTIVFTQLSDTMYTDTNSSI